MKRRKLTGNLHTINIDLALLLENMILTKAFSIKGKTDMVPDVIEI
jgi:hypothetical protein